jgi:hypothetical protein
MNDSFVGNQDQLECERHHSNVPLPEDNKVTGFDIFPIPFICIYFFLASNFFLFFFCFQLFFYIKLFAMDNVLEKQRRFDLYHFTFNVYIYIWKKTMINPTITVLMKISNVLNKLLSINTWMMPKRTEKSCIMNTLSINS